MNEIDEDFFCSTAGKYDCPEKGNCAGCPDRHRKYPTPEQYKEEYGKDYPDDGAAYALMTHGFSSIERWIPVIYSDYKEDGEPIVCACTPFGNPGDKWRPV